MTCNWMSPVSKFDFVLTIRLVTKAFGDSAGPVKFINLCPPPSTSRKHAAKVFYHLLGE